MPPPHFRRWMQKFMKRWHKRNAPGCYSGDEDQKEEKGEKAEKMEGDSGEQGENNGEEFLRNVGECVANMLDTFGEFFFFSLQLSRLMIKPTKWHVRPAKTQISLGIRPV